MTALGLPKVSPSNAGRSGGIVTRPTSPHHVEPVADDDGDVRQPDPEAQGGHEGADPSSDEWLGEDPDEEQIEGDEERRPGDVLDAETWVG